MEKALVLCGGGSLGSYEMGAWKALREVGERFSYVAGTSIGAFIGAFVALDEFDKCQRLWDQVDIDDVMKDGFSLSANFFNEARKVQTSKILAFAKSYISHRGADIQPFREMMDREIDYAKISACKTPIDIVVTSYPSLKEVDVTLNGLPPDEIREALLATSACYPLFPVHSYNGKKWVDGGFTNNLPIDLAVKRGASEIVAICLPAIPKIPQNYELTRLPNVTLIAPNRDIGTIMDFTRKRLDENMALGYLDARKALKLNKGYDYYFVVKQSEKDIADRFARQLFKKDPYSFEAITTALGLDPGKQHHATAYLMKTAEMAAKALGIDPLKEYTLREMDYLIHGRLEDEVSPQDEGNFFTYRRLSEKMMKRFLLTCYGAKKHRKKPVFHKDLFSNSPEAQALLLLVNTVARHQL